MSDDRVVLAYGDRALLVELGSTERVMSWTSALTEADWSEVADLVPAAETLLVVGREGAELSALRRRLEDLAEPEALATPSAEEALEIPVRYNGADLADVADLTGLSEDEVVAAHTGATWRVAFGGFAPGFGYLVGDDERLHVPRRETSRTKVPVGAVGLAGEFSGVYPRESPGGWQLIGTTDLAIWDLEREPPALLRPGVAVRFVADS